jgi:MaoC dehydratase-like protein
MVDQIHKGREFATFTYTIERGKLNEFLQAIGDDNPAYHTDDPPLPPTFATVFTFWGGMRLDGVLRQIGVEMWNVIHSEQEYQLEAGIHIGDTVSGRAKIADIYAKAGMEFVEILTNYYNQNNTMVVRDRALLIVRG